MLERVSSQHFTYIIDQVMSIRCKYEWCVFIILVASNVELVTELLYGRSDRLPMSPLRVFDFREGGTGGTPRNFLFCGKGS